MRTEHWISTCLPTVRRWKDGIASYWSTFITRREGEVAAVEDFLGKVLAFEEARSPSGFVLPAGTLLQRGYVLREVAGPDAEVGPNEIGYLFSRDEQNTLDLVLEGRVAGGGVSNGDYEELPSELKGQIMAFDKTIAVPRQLVSIRTGLDPN